MLLCLCVYYVGSPIIVKGSFEPKPSYIASGFTSVKIGAPAYVRRGNAVIIDCVTHGTQPIVLKWYRNGSPYTSGGGHSVTLLNPTNGDVVKCTATNRFGADTAKSTIYVGGKWFMNIQYACIIVYVCIHICPLILHIW